MPIITPTIHFNGRCEEAIKLYEKAFDAKVDYIIHYSDRDERDWNEPLTPGQENYVYHSEIYIGSQRIMMADNPGHNYGKSPFMKLTVTFDCAEDVKNAYELLKDGATIVNPMQSTTYSSCLVSLVDRFGVCWGLMTEQTEK